MQGFALESPLTHSPKHKFLLLLLFPIDRCTDAATAFSALVEACVGWWLISFVSDESGLENAVGSDSCPDV